jgi:hypothetical protein
MASLGQTLSSNAWIMFHHPCTDGLASAFILAENGTRGDVEFIPLQVRVKLI